MHLPFIQQVTAFLKAMWANIKRRGSLFALGLLYSFAVVPMVSLPVGSVDTGMMMKHRAGYTKMQHHRSTETRV